MKSQKQRQTVPFYQPKFELDFHSVEEVDAFVWLSEDATDKAPGLSRAEQAQRLVWKAYLESVKSEKIRMAQEALRIDAHCTDAYVLLAQHQALDSAAALKLFKAAVLNGRHAVKRLAQNSPMEPHQSLWDDLRTRPYLRALYGFAWTLEEMGAQTKALYAWLDCLKADHDDHLGARYRALTALMDFDRLDDADELLMKYPKWQGAFPAYTRALINFKRCGDSPETMVLMEQAVAANTHVAQILFSKSAVPDLTPWTAYELEPGSVEEAEAYIWQALALWLDDTTLKWLKRCAQYLGDRQELFAGLANLPQRRYGQIIAKSIFDFRSGLL